MAGRLIHLGLFAMASLFLPDAVRAQFLFTTNNGAITISKYTGASSIATIPATTNNHPVVSIGAQALSGQTAVLSVIIPSGVTNIGQNAFANCTRLTTAAVSKPPSSPISNIAVRNNEFGFTFTGTNHQVFVVEVTTNLVNWQPLATNTLSGTTFNFTDPLWENYSQRYYRIVEP